MALNCKVRHCMHNDEGGKCLAASVVIRGANATTSDQTNCNSFTQKSAEDSLYAEFATEFTSSSRPATTSNITCTARNCKHNKQQRCQAENVQVSSHCATCDTFNC